MTALGRIFAVRSARWGVGLLLLVALSASVLIVKRDYFSQLDEGETRYLNVLYNVLFDVPSGYTVEDIGRTDAILLYPGAADAQRPAQSEDSFLDLGGLAVRSVRHIPGTRAIFELFQKQEFEQKLTELGNEFRSERAVTGQGFDAFKVFVTKPAEEVHVVIDAPVAYWVTGQTDGPLLQTVSDSLRTVNPDETSEIKKPVADFENFLTDIRNAKLEAAYDKLTPTLQKKLSEAALRDQVKPFAVRLERTMQLISIRSNGTIAYLRYTLEDSQTDVYSFLGAKLIQNGSRWQVDSFVIDKDRPGNPSEEIIKRVKKELRKEDLRGGRVGGQ